MEFCKTMYEAKKFWRYSLVLFLILIGCKKESIITNETGTFTDSRDNHAYKWVKIGQQIWMAENLAYLPAVSPPSVESITLPHIYVYGFDFESSFESGRIDLAVNQINYKTYGSHRRSTNSSGFTALPSGFFSPNGAIGIFIDLDYETSFWSSTVSQGGINDESFAEKFQLSSGNPGANISSGQRNSGQPVRCLRN